MTAILERQDTGSRFEIDAVPTWTVNRSWQPTSAPVEAEPGRVAITITDQIQAMPVGVSLDCTVSESPPRQDQYGTGPARLAAFIAWVLNAEGQLLTLYLPNRPTLRDLVVTTFPDDGDLYAHLRARLTLMSVTIVETGTADIPAQRRVKPGTEAGLAPQEDKGQAPTEPVSERKKSALAAALDFLRGGG